MAFDTVLLSRLQFAWTIGYHILWPAYTIGISGFIVIVNAAWLATGRDVYRDLLRFWIHLFALGFAMGVVTGVVLSYEIGTNWSGFVTKTANVIGPFFAYEVLTAFFLEAGFIGVMLFGMNRVGKRLHFFACCMVALGAIFSAFWILAANSWMQTPAGFTVDAEGRFQIASWWDAVFNPSLPYRFLHMVTAAYISGAFVVIGVSGFYLWQRRHLAVARAGFSIALWMALVLTPAQVAIGDAHGLNTLRYQPMKLAAIEARWETGRRVPLTLFAWPNMSEERNDYALDVPELGSLILTHEWDGEVKGLKEVSPEERAYVPLPFFAFRLMVGIGVTLLGIALVGVYLRWRGRLYDTRWFAVITAFSSPLSFIAVLAGWTVTETGRQPYIVYGLIKTADAAAPVAARAVSTSLALFVIVYSVLLLAFFWYAGRVVFRGPYGEDGSSAPEATRPGVDSAPSRLAGG
ncbi:MAG TPA: cytochrome ubiquinol oxidase subunit I [Stellaceae bacterium]|nr:cytochrome ubiquinol oxidase subunit I [Stellaceae bacterium]